MEDPKTLRTFEERMGEMLRAALESGERQSAKSWGKPLDLDGYFETPPELRMAFKVLNDAGCTPPEVELLKRIAAMRDELAALHPTAVQAARLRERILKRDLEISIRMERRSARPR